MYKTTILNEVDIVIYKQMYHPYTNRNLIDITIIVTELKNNVYKTNSLMCHIYFVSKPNCGNTNF